MRILFVVPSEISSGEAVTALDAARRVAARGGAAAALASPAAARLLRGGGFPGEVAPTGEGADANDALFRDALARFRPDAVLFADLPLLDLSNGVSRFGPGLRRWLEEAEGGPLRASFDHLGYAQAPLVVDFGPPHRCLHSERFRPVPPSVELLLPAPMAPPEGDPALRGRAVRCAELPPAPTPGSRAAARARLGWDPAARVVLHLVPAWAGRIAERLRLPLHRHLPQLLAGHFAEAPWPVELLSLNHGGLLPEGEFGRLRARNTGPVAREAFDDTLAAADLLVTENGVSSSIGRAALLGTPAAHLANGFGAIEAFERAGPRLLPALRAMEAEASGAVFPFEVFPLWNAAELARLPVAARFAAASPHRRVELFDGGGGGGALLALLGDTPARAAALREGEVLRARLAAAPPVERALAELLAARRRPLPVPAA